MNKTLLAVTTAISLATLSLATPTQVMADNDRHHQNRGNTHYAKVIRIQPIFKTIRVAYEKQNCRRDNDKERDNRHAIHESPAKLLLGGQIGGVIGHELGENSSQNLASFTGAVIGTAIAHTTGVVYYAVEGHSPRQQQHCHTEIQYKNERKLVGYDVTYRYQGRLYTKRMHEHPGERIKIDNETHDERNHHR